MLCYWGAQVREGFGLPGEIKHVNDGLNYVCTKSEIQDMSAGRCFVGFIRDGKVSVLKLRTDPSGHDGKLKPLTLKKEKIRSVMCGGSGAVLLSDGGRVFIKDNLFKGLANRYVIQIACGDQHSMALTQNGQLFVWGKNSHGQLGLKELPESGSEIPQHIECLDGVPVSQISAGGDHSFVLSLSGVVFGWGKNSSGQLGLGDTEDRHVPTVVNSLNGKKTQLISCGGEHTATLSKGGVVFTFGSGKFGQLGHNSFKDEHRPPVVAELWGSKVSQVTCGGYHTLVLVESSKKIYAFGCGKQGQLGNGKIINQSVPSPVELTTEFNVEYAIGKLIAGENHSFALFFKVPGSGSTNPQPKQSRRIVTLDDRVIDQWVSECDAKSWKAVKNEINKVFSSAASLNGSFLKSCDKHYQTSVELCGLDLNLIKKSFAKLSVNERVMSEVVKIVQDALLPSLKSSPVSFEALRVYVLLPELIRVCQEQYRAELLHALSSKILQLKPDALKVLENVWSKLPDDCLRGLVKLFRITSAELIDNICLGEMTEQPCLENILQVFQMVNKVCCSTHCNVPSNDFIIHKISDLLDTLQTTLEEIEDAENLQELFMCHFMVDLKDHYVKIIEMLSNFPFVADTASKQRMFTFLQNPNNMIFPLDNALEVNRKSVLEDTLQYLKQDNLSLQYPLKVTFAGENGIDEGGLSAEFFSLLSQSLLTWEKNLLEICENSLVWFNLEHTHKEDFYYLGTICGMALFNRQCMNIDFPLALFKKLLDQRVTLNDLEEISPVEARCLKDLLEEEEEVVEMLYLDFTIKGQELVSNGVQIPVTKINRQKYVDLYVDFIFNKSVMNQFEQFSEGFSKGCPVNAWRMFHPEELRELFHGSPVYQWEELSKCTTYQHCSPSDELIKNFWTVFMELSEENKQKFLFFMYGTNRVPAGGLSKLSLKIVQVNVPDSDDRFPEAQTCFNTLRLPKYTDIDTLRNKLIHAISFCRVFGRQ
ncbi:probable E3 ubiquitin-protein ligase HERC4 [Misgurnus anguillicaudatus]|uniref:probable E3 ubiquitin-protein ligase HERC4 n=1 Tax=Misgurnus anguillicaudatus TaxID=75329 RepID=UPI003CCF384D